MLTKNLLRFRRVSGAIKLKFVETDNANLLNLAGSLLALYDPESQPSRAEIEENSAAICNAEHDITLAKGLNKLIQDRCEFSHNATVKLPELREQLFTKSANFYENISEDATLYDLQSAVEKIQPPNDYQDLLYADLPESELLQTIKPITPKELLERYNVSLVQSFLLTSSSITLTIFEQDIAQLRRVFKYLKFFRLLATIKMSAKTNAALTKLNAGKSKTPAKIVIDIDGPLSLFESSSRYGLKLASFFPAVCALKKWQLKSNVKVGDKNYKLSVSEKEGLKSHYRNFTAYIPKEIQVFHKTFQEKSKDWKIVGSTPLIPLSGQEVLFPDLCFLHQESKKIVYLELFHRWHIWQLQKRLEGLKSNDDFIIGIERVLYRKKEIKQLVDNSGLLDTKVFLFSDFPACQATIRSLNSIC